MSKLADTLYMDVNEAGAKDLISAAFAGSWEIHLDPLPFNNWRVSTKNEPLRKLAFARIIAECAAAEPAETE